jgi:hypothetical protein
MTGEAGKRNMSSYVKRRPGSRQGVFLKDLAALVLGFFPVLLQALDLFLDVQLFLFQAAYGALVLGCVQRFGADHFVEAAVFLLQGFHMALHHWFNSRFSG